MGTVEQQTAQGRYGALERRLDELDESATIMVDHMRQEIQDGKDFALDAVASERAARVLDTDNVRHYVADIAGHGERTHTRLDAFTGMGWKARFRWLFTGQL